MTTIVHLTELSNRWMTVPCSCFDWAGAAMSNCIWCAGDGTVEIIEDRAELPLHDDDAVLLGSLIDVDFRTAGAMSVGTLRDRVESALKQHDEETASGLLGDAYTLTMHPGIVLTTLVRWYTSGSDR